MAADIRIMINGVGKLSKAAAAHYIATGVVLEEDFRDALTPKHRASYNALDEDTRLQCRRSLGGVTVASGTVTDGVWKPDFGMEVTVYGRSYHSLFNHEISVSTGGTSRDAAHTRTYAESLMIAAEIAEMAEAISMPSNE